MILRIALKCPLRAGESRRQSRWAVLLCEGGERPRRADHLRSIYSRTPNSNVSRNSRESEAVVSTGSIRIRQCHHHHPCPNASLALLDPGHWRNPRFPISPTGFAIE